MGTQAGLVNRLHTSYIHRRRVRVICDLLSEWIPENASVVDIGCGDGLLAKELRSQRPDIRIQGLDVLVRADTAVPVTAFDGKEIPLQDNEVDIALLVDVVHHAEDPVGLLREAKRISRGAALLKDHTREGCLAKQLLGFMDRIGNLRHGVVIPYTYWTKQEWQQVFADLELTVEEETSDLRLYPWFLDWLFGRSLHFAARLVAA